jgi:hypothetical protein
MARRLRPVFITLATLAACSPAQWSAQAQDRLKVAIPQRGAWDAGLVELGQLWPLPPRSRPRRLTSIAAGTRGIGPLSGTARPY